MKVIKLNKFQKGKKQKEAKDWKQYKRLFLKKRQGGLSRKIIAEYEAIHNNKG